MFTGRLKAGHRLALHCSGSSATFDSFGKACLSGQRVAHQHRRHRRCARDDVLPHDRGRRPTAARNTIRDEALDDGQRAKNGVKQKVPTEVTVLPMPEAFVVVGTLRPRSLDCLFFGIQTFVFRRRDA